MSHINPPPLLLYSPLSVSVSLCVWVNTEVYTKLSQWKAHVHKFHILSQPVQLAIACFWSHRSYLGLCCFLFVTFKLSSTPTYVKEGLFVIWKLDGAVQGTEPVWLVLYLKPLEQACPETMYGISARHTGWSRVCVCFAHALCLVTFDYSRNRRHFKSCHNHSNAFKKCPLLMRPLIKLMQGSAKITALTYFTEYIGGFIWSFSSQSKINNIISRNVNHVLHSLPQVWEQDG